MIVSPAKASGSNVPVKCLVMKKRTMPRITKQSGEKIRWSRVTRRDDSCFTKGRPEKASRVHFSR
jgi:hypothetical protein